MFSTVTQIGAFDFSDFKAKVEQGKNFANELLGEKGEVITCAISVENLLYLLVARLIYYTVAYRYAAY